MIPRNRPDRILAAVGATVAAGATAMLAVTTTASADEPGRCLQNVNIREEPDAESRIVALCEAGTEVALGEERDGFVRVDELGGWAAKDYVKADETSSSDDRSDSSGDDSHGDSDSDYHGDSHDSDDDDQGNSVGDSRPGGDGDSAAEATDGDGAQLDGLLS
jgi:hypothetical protein